MKTGVIGKALTSNDSNGNYRLRYVNNNGDLGNTYNNTFGVCP